MQSADMILSIICEKAKKDKNYTFKRLYRNLFNKDFYIKAYDRIYGNEGNMTSGVDNTTIDGFNIEIVEKIIETMRAERYYPKPVKRVYIPKEKGKKRPLGVPSFKDKLIQEVIRQMLESIYEPIFKDTSHGFRPNRSCQTALYKLKNTCRGANWVIEGDIKSFYDNIDHEILISLLRNKINDGRFLELIRRFVDGGYLEFKKVYKSLSGIPQGGIVSPILANVYLHELDVYMEEIIYKYTKGKRKKENPLYTKLYGKRVQLKKNGDYNGAKYLLKQMQKLHSSNDMDENYIRVKYVRYADDFVIFIIGSKELAKEIRSEIDNFLKNRLKLELNLEKTVITNLKDERIRFLGYEIAKTKEDTKIVKNTLGIKKRSINGSIQLLVPNEVIIKKLAPYVKNNRSIHFGPRVNYPILDIINEYNAEIRGLYNFYSLATDVSRKLNKFKFYHYYSLAKTIARKEESSVKKVIAKYGIMVKNKNGTGTRNIIGIKYLTKEGERVMTYFNESIKRLDNPRTKMSDNLLIIKPRHQLIDRINANTCELCGRKGKNKEFEVHHVRKLKDIKRKYFKRGKIIPNWVLIMSSINRKTLVVCKDCHNKIHSGKLIENRSLENK